ncbi:hypothetical protein NQ318_000462 [Aromia moschata]|uniref:Reverse transcriptase domain-containing protein n=1 Tax=Aromia moschata TaxID=1265417 RepID=A0AAV8YU40_9CUCU|nr:hypothetical protein NQ318_000462 [Aromia moschata]
MSIPGDNPETKSGINSRSQHSRRTSSRNYRDVALGLNLANVEHWNACNASFRFLITVNIFNNMRERQWTEVKDKFEYFPRVWFRYVDDIFATHHDASRILDRHKEIVKDLQLIMILRDQMAMFRFYLNFINPVETSSCVKRSLNKRN